MKEASPFEVEGLFKGYPRGSAWHSTFYTPTGRHRKNSAAANCAGHLWRMIHHNPSQNQPEILE